MSFSPIEAIAAAGTRPSGSTRNKAVDDAFADLLEEQSPAAILSEITEDGMYSYWKWQIREMEKKIAAQVMAEMKVTKESVASMSGEAKAELQQRILEEVARRLKQAVAEMEKKRREGPRPLAALDSSTLSGLLQQQ